MPIYEYQCDDCGVRFEEMRRITDDTTPDCRECESASVHRLVSLSSFHLKGTGWYVTDYARKESRADGDNGGGNGGGNGKSSTASEGSTDTPKKTEDKAKDTAGSADAGKKAADKPSADKS